MLRISGIKGVFPHRHPDPASFVDTAVHIENGLISSDKATIH